VDYDVALDKQAELIQRWISNDTNYIKLSSYLEEWLTDGKISRPERPGILPSVAYSLIHGECFFWSDKVVKTLTGAIDTLGLETSITRDLLPCSHGFWWFEKPACFDGTYISGLSWTSWMSETKKNESGENVGELFATDTPSKMAGFSLHTFRKTNFDSLLEIPTSSYIVPVPQTMGHLAQGNDPRTTFKLRVFITMLLFIKQRILTVISYSPSRATRKRIDKIDPDLLRDIKVVTLRAHEYKPTDGHINVDWQCQWIVRGHWRNQYYPSTRTHEAIWILPHLKGPEDKPLKNPDHVFQVVR
jgi:hypothetical protein